MKPEIFYEFKMTNKDNQDYIEIENSKDGPICSMEDVDTYDEQLYKGTF